ncbi:MAG: hypothetical protein HRT61_04715 [Ekhidna sp.]|nr:hypothetical protein [Ekhidna sp.]
MRNELISGILFFSVSIVFGQELIFEKREKLPRAGSNITEVTDGENLYIIGGKRSGNGRKNQLFRFNPALEEWLDLSDSFDVFRSGGISSAVYLEEYRLLFICADILTHEGLKYQIAPYDVDTYKNTELITISVGVYSQSNAYHDGLLYIFGGHKTDNNSTEDTLSSSTFYLFDPAELIVKKLTDMPFYGATKGVVIGDKLFLVGSETLKKEKDREKISNSNDIVSYNFTEGAWTLEYTVDEEIKNPELSSYKEYIFVIGHQENKILIIDTKNKQHTNLSMNLRGIASSAIVVQNQLHILGGLDKSSSPVRNHYSISCEKLIEVFQTSKSY